MREEKEKVAYSGRFVEVKESVIDNYVWEKVYLPDSLVVFPVTEKNQIVMIEEKRPHEKQPSRLKFVTGHIHGSENPLIAANRELMEEVGLRANSLREFFKHESTGTLNSNFHYIIAKRLEPKKIPNPDGEDTILAIHNIELDKFESYLFEGKLDWNISTLGLFKILHYYKKNRLEELFNEI